MNKLKMLSVALLPLLSIGVQAADVGEFAGMQVAESKKSKSVVHVYDREDNRVKKSRSVLKRSDDGICLTTKTSNLDEGAYTNWLVVYNNPEFCTNPDGIGGNCTFADLSNEDVNGTVMWVGANIVGPNKKGNFNYCVAEGELSHQVMFGADGIVDAQKAEIHIRIRNHGPAIYSDPAVLGAQLNSVGGGCASGDVEGFACSDVQLIAHPGNF